MHARNVGSNGNANNDGHFVRPHGTQVRWARGPQPRGAKTAGNSSTRITTLAVLCTTMPIQALR
jgi:hypothetical protein